MDLNDEILKTIIFSDFMRKLVLVHAACCYLCYIIHQRQRLKRRRVPHIPTQSTIETQKVRDEIMSRLRNSEKCYDVLRMGLQAFKVCVTFCGDMVIFKTHSVPQLKWKMIRGHQKLLLHVLECHHKMQCLLKVRKDDLQKMMNSGM